MLKFIFKRLLEALQTLFILITFSFFLMRLAPGSPFTSERAYPPEVMANIEAKYHLNEPLHKQYFLYLENLSKGDFGPSFKYKDQSVNDLIASAFPVSLKLGMVAFAFAVVLGITAGTLAALNQNSRWDYFDEFLNAWRHYAKLRLRTSLSADFRHLFRLVTCWRLEWRFSDVHYFTCSLFNYCLCCRDCAYHAWLDD